MYGIIYLMCDCKYRAKVYVGFSLGDIGFCVVNCEFCGTLVLVATKLSLQLPCTC